MRGRSVTCTMAVLPAEFLTITPPATLRRERQEPQHVAAREGGDQGFLRIDRRCNRHRYAHDLRRGRSRHLHTAVEVPGMAAAEAVVGEGGVAPLPVDAGTIFVCCHGAIVR